MVAMSCSMNEKYLSDEGDGALKETAVQLHSGGNMGTQKARVCIFNIIESTKSTPPKTTGISQRQDE